MLPEKLHAQRVPHIEATVNRRAVGVTARSVELSAHDLEGRPFAIRVNRVPVVGATPIVAKGKLAHRNPARPVNP